MKRVLVAAFAATILVPVAATSAQASTSVSPFGALASGPSINAGYVVAASRVKNVSASWVMPTASCTSTDTASTFWVGLAASSSASTVRVGVDADCKGGQPVYVGWFKMSGQPRQHFGRKIAAGDVLAASLKGGAHLAVSLEDDTAGWGIAGISSAGFTADAAGVMASERVGASGVRPLTDFGTVTFSKVRIDGAPIAGQTVYRLAMRNRAGVLQARPSHLSAKGTFTDTWLHS